MHYVLCVFVRAEHECDTTSVSRINLFMCVNPPAGNKLLFGHVTH